MKRRFLLFFISLYINGVFGDETVRVSVNDGDCVTLHTHAELKSVELITWRFKGERIARINRPVSDTPVYSDERFTDRLEMNQTGDLTISNITSELTGDYQLEINGETKIKTFSVSLSPKGEKMIIGDSVSLHIDVTDEQRKDKIYWRIKYKNSLVAEIITENAKISRPFIDERFRGRVILNDQTGDVIITNMKEEDSGDYEADVTINSTYTIHKTVSYTAPGVSSGLIAGIWVAGVLLVIAAAVFAAAVIFRHRKKKLQVPNMSMASTGPLIHGPLNGDLPKV